jgi:hypothetical protein
MITSEHRREQCRLATGRWRSRHPVDVEFRRVQQNAWLAKNPAKMLISAARRRAKCKSIPCTITEADLSPLPTHCPVLGVRLAYGPGRGRKLYENGAAASLDRIHNHLGYVRGNVIVICLRANLLKGQATVEELRRIADFYGRLP